MSGNVDNGRGCPIVSEIDSTFASLTTGQPRTLWLLSLAEVIF